MSHKSASDQRRTLASLISPTLSEAYTDFILSRQASNCTPATLEFYRFTTLAFLKWSEEQGVANPEQITAKLVRQYLSKLSEAGKKDTTLHANARAIRTLVKFWHAEGYLSTVVKFEMPKLAKKRLPVLTADELKVVIQACNTRDKAIVLLMADSGLRRNETIGLNWGDVNMSNGLIRVRQGKGRKDRAAVIGAKTRRALLTYKRTVSHGDDDPLFQSRTNERLTGTGLLIIYRRLTEATGIHITPHAMRRTFVALSLSAGMDVIHLQGLGGWESLEMVYHYAQMVDSDLLEAHKAHSPVDNL